MKLFPLILLIVLVKIIYNKQIDNFNNYINLNKKLHKFNINDIKQNSLFIYPNRNMENILKKFNDTMNSQIEYDYNPIIKTYTYTNTNMDRELKDKTVFIIENIIKSINKNCMTNYEFLNIENIYKSELFDNNSIISAIFFMHEKDKFSTRKLILEYTLTNTNFIIHHIKTTQNLQTLNKNNNVKSISYNKNNWNLNSQLHLLRTLYTTRNLNFQKLSKYDNHKDKHAHSQLSKLPYVNPTLFNDNYIKIKYL